MTAKYKWIKNSYKYTNWRFIGQSNSIDCNIVINSLSNRKKGVWVLLDNFKRSCFIYGLTIKEFLQTSEHKQCHVDSHCWHGYSNHYWDTPHISYCKNCNGAGKFDWISRVTGPLSFDKVKYKYVRDETKILKFKDSELSKGYILAPTKVFRGEHICKECMGTGIHINSNSIQNLLLHDIDEIWNEENYECKRV